MSASPRRRSLRAPSSIAVLLLTALSCVDAPSAPTDELSPSALLFAPRLSLVGPNGPAQSLAQTDALDEAFDLVDRFRMVVRRASDNVVVVDTIISVTPGQDQYELAVPVFTTSAAEQFLVSLTAFQGTIELFSAPDIPVRATRDDTPASSPEVALTYSGPGATATSVEVEPAQVVLGPGSTTTLTSKVLADDGSVVAGVPVSWTSTAEGVATVEEGVVTSVSDGIAHIVVALPTGLEARTAVYVVSGTLAYVQGGVVRTSAPAGGDAADRGGDGGATAPAWSADGARLFYAEGGSVRLAGDGSALFGGGWPSVSPDGTKLAADDGGVVVFANDDGSNATTGPAGSTPVWTGDGELLVGGGSVQSVRADGSGRVDVAGGSAGLPAIGPGGAVAYVDGAALMVAGGGTVAMGVGGRPSWSPDGLWLAVAFEGGIAVVPADGTAPPALLPGLDGAAHPAFQPSGALSAPSALSLSGSDPDPPVPGQSVKLLGAGFDWIIPSNNRIFWPGETSESETVTEMVTESTLSTVMPRLVTAGQIRVDTRTGSAVLDFVPMLGAIEIHATTQDGTGVAGVAATVLAADGSEAASGVTDDNGDFVVSGLVAGSYTLTLTQPPGFALAGVASRTLDVDVEAVVVVDVSLTPLIDRVSVSPDNPRMAVGELVDITVEALDLNGRPITVFERTFWGAGTSHVNAGGSGLTGVVAGVHPTLTEGEALFIIGLNSQLFSFPATVTSHIEGTVHKTVDSESQPAGGHGVSLEKDGTQIATTVTDAGGRYRFDGLFAGSYTVEPILEDGYHSSPSSTAITLGQNTPSGQADFSISTGSAVGDGDIVVVNDWNIWDTSNNPPLLVQNLVATAANSGTKVVWWCGRQANPSGTSLSSGICAASINSDGSG